MMNENVPFVTAAYLGGLFDTEGSFTIKPSGSYAPKIAFYNNDKKLIDFVCAHIGGYLRESRKGQFALEFTRQDICTRLCEVMEPYLITKKEQCQILKSIPKATRAQRVEMHKRMLELNAIRVDSKFPERAAKGRQTDLRLATQEQWAYFAGVLDGDGAIAMQPQRWKKTIYHYPWINIYSVKPEVLIYLHGIFGGMIKSRKRKHKWATEGSLQFADQTYLYPIFQGLIPHMISKQSQAIMAMYSCLVPASERQLYRDEVYALNHRPDAKIDTETVATVFHNLGDFISRAWSDEYISLGREKFTDADAYSLSEYAAKAAA